MCDAEIERAADDGTLGCRGTDRPRSCATSQGKGLEAGCRCGRSGGRSSMCSGRPRAGTRMAQSPPRFWQNRPPGAGQFRKPLAKRAGEGYHPGPTCKRLLVSAYSGCASFRDWRRQAPHDRGEAVQGDTHDLRRRPAGGRLDRLGLAGPQRPGNAPSRYPRAGDARGRRAQLCAGRRCPCPLKRPQGGGRRRLPARRARRHSRTRTRACSSSTASIAASSLPRSIASFDVLISSVGVHDPHRDRPDRRGRRQGGRHHPARPYRSRHPASPGWPRPCRSSRSPGRRPGHR